eukprot:Rhum_TRINITY_DN25057_c0_g1::Rhum_TRINITY_DN25057_c0_g1_i1::g.181043::m.181043
MEETTHSCADGGAGVQSVVDQALTLLVQQRPSKPQLWLADYIRRECEKAAADAESDEAYLARHGVKAAVEAATAGLAAEPTPQALVVLEKRLRDASEAEPTNMHCDPLATTPPRRRGSKYVADGDTPPSSPGLLVRGRSFLQDWTSGLQRYFLKTQGNGIQCMVHEKACEDSRVISAKRDYDGISVDKQVDGWLRITEGTGWVQKQKPNQYKWVPMGTEAGIVTQAEIPGGFQLNQRVTSDGLQEGTVLGKGVLDTGKVLVRWDTSGDLPEGEPVEEDVANLEIAVTRVRTRAPTMVWGKNEALLPKQDKAFEGLPVIVFDLDETLIYARAGPLHQRAGVQEMFKMLHGKAEVVIWTAGMRSYAQAILRSIDPENVVSHCIYRHPKWHPAVATGQRKNLSQLGRPLAHTLLVENSPESLLGDEHNAVLLRDFEGSHDKDATIPMLFRLLKALVNTPDSTVPEFLAGSNLVSWTCLTPEDASESGGDSINAYVLQDEDDVDACLSPLRFADRGLVDVNAASTAEPAQAGFGRVVDEPEDH